MEREWEAGDTTAVEVFLTLLDSDAARPGHGDAVVLEEEDGLAVPGSGLLALDARSTRALGSGFSFQLGLQAASADEGGSDAARIGEAEIAWTGPRHRLGVGRSTLRWGAGASGSLLAGTTAPPRWQLRWRTDRALALPTFGWEALRGRTWTGSVFLAYLDDDAREIADPLLLGHRISLQPWPFLELSATRTILFGGEGRTSRLDLGGILDILLARNENLRGDRPPSDSDQRASYELRLRPPARSLGSRLQGLELFWEYAGEDTNDPPLPSAVAHHLGVMAKILHWTLLVESVETRTGRNRWYDHVVYGPAAYSYRGFLLGHPLGGDGTLWELTIWSPSAPLRGKLRIRREAYGYFRSPRERRFLVEAAGRIELGPGLTAEAALTRTAREGGSAEAPRAPEWARLRGDLRLHWSP